MRQTQQPWAFPAIRVCRCSVCYAKQHQSRVQKKDCLFGQPFYRIVVRFTARQNDRGSSPYSRPEQNRARIFPCHRHKHILQPMHVILY